MKPVTNLKWSIPNWDAHEIENQSTYTYFAVYGSQLVIVYFSYKNHETTCYTMRNGTVFVRAYEGVDYGTTGAIKIARQFMDEVNGAAMKLEQKQEEA